VEIVGMNFMNLMNNEHPSCRFKEYLFNRYADGISQHYRYSVKTYMDTLTYDEKYNKARKINPDEDLYYICPITSFQQLYKRKKKLNSAIQIEIENNKDIIQKMGKVTGKHTSPL
jgi:hypothetical protein